MEFGIPTSSVVEATDLQHLDQISAASTTPPLVIADKVIGNAVRGRIHATNCVKHSAIQILTAFNSSTRAMNNNLVKIWRYVISHQQVLLIGFWTPVQINTLHLTLQPWLLQNHISIMIICMLVMVMDFPYLISII